MASSNRVVTALQESYLGLHDYLLCWSVNKKVKASACATHKELIRKMTMEEFVEDFALARDCLSQLSILSKILQNRGINVVMANWHVKWPVNSRSLVKKVMSNK